ncbi:DUF6134 family protein [Pseudozobellia thermophila]|uniref:Uncharacterized protein n=1 Tax=Pseudozobellia thermophila TaxID=192903 RepID=A0A1M6EJ93_9FLAO|nr:DUF6134 family protein [Pseudozobellia thermophila]SHI85501.1 hypothetical protein SAMN04488513_10276 [Pseudozobellia thermophila]
MVSVNQIIFFLFVLTQMGTGETPPDITTATDSLRFDIVMKGKVVGNLEAIRKKKEGKVRFQSSTTIKTRVITDIEVNYNYDVVFEDKVLEQAYVTIEVNQKTHANTTTKREGNGYQILINDKKDRVVEEPINYATIQLYFEEPVNTTRCYSEQDGTFNSLVPLGGHRYKKINSKGKENTYSYSNGYLEKANIDGGLVKFDIVAHR